MSKEALVILFDVSRSMGTHRQEFERGKECLRGILKDKLINSPKDEVALVLIGSEETNNPINEAEGEGYENVEVKQPIIPLNFEFFQVISALEPSRERDCDIVDGIILAFDLLEQKVGKKKSYSKRILVVTDCRCDFDNEGDTRTLLKNLPRNRVGFSVINVAEQDNNKTTEKALKEFCERLRGEMVAGKGGHFLNCSMFLNFFGHIQKKRRVTRGQRLHLDILPGFQIPIQRFKYAEKNVLGRGALTRVGPSILTGQTGKVKTYSQFSLKDEPDVAVKRDEEDVVKAYVYGKGFYVPISAEDDKGIPTVKSMQLLAFVNNEDVPREQFIGESYYVCCDKGTAKVKIDDIHKRRFQCLVQAMVNGGYVAIARFVYRTNSAPNIVCLIPKSDTDFYFDCVKLPFSDDVRYFQFGDLNEVTVSNPQLKAIEEFIESMSLEKAESREVLNKDTKLPYQKPIESYEPKDMFDPINQYLFQCVNHRALETRDDEQLRCEGLELPKPNLQHLSSFLPDVLLPRPVGEDSMIDRLYSDQEERQELERLRGENPLCKMFERAKPKMDRLKALFPITKRTGEKRKLGEYFLNSGASIGGTLGSGGVFNSPNRQSNTGDGGFNFSSSATKRRKLNSGEDVGTNFVENVVVGTTNPEADLKKFATSHKQVYGKAMELLPEAVMKIIGYHSSSEKSRLLAFGKAKGAIVRARNDTVTLFGGLEVDEGKGKFNYVKEYNAMVEDLKFSYFNTDESSKYEFWRFLESNDSGNIGLITSEEVEKGGVSVVEAQNFFTVEPERKKKVAVIQEVQDEGDDLDGFDF